MKNNVYSMEERKKFQGKKFPMPDTLGAEKEGDEMLVDTYLKEIKDDMREREERSERRFQEQQELLLNRIDKKMDDRLSNIESEIKDMKNSNFKWGIGIIVTILVAFIGILPQLLEVIVTMMQN